MILMIDEMAIIPNIVHTIYTGTLSICSLIANGLLIYVILSTPNTHLGSYRFLLIGFATTDILVSSVHALLIPRVYGTPFGYIFYGQNMMKLEEAFGKYAGHVFVVFFYLTFIILCWHYLYRAIVIYSSQLCTTFVSERKWTITGMAVVLTLLYTGGWVAAVQIGFLPTQLKRVMYRDYILNETGIDLTADPKPGFLAIVFRVQDERGNSIWQMDAILAIAIALSIFFITMIVILVNIPLFTRREAHKQLFRALIVQTVVPCLLSYLPLSVIFIFPICGFHLGGLAGDILIMTTAIFPTIDPILIIIFVPKYRDHALLVVATSIGMKTKYSEWKAGRSRSAVTTIQSVIKSVTTVSKLPFSGKLSDQSVSAQQDASSVGQPNHSGRPSNQLALPLNRSFRRHNETVRVPDESIRFHNLQVPVLNQSSRASLNDTVRLSNHPARGLNQPQNQATLSRNSNARVPFRPAWVPRQNPRIESCFESMRGVFSNERSNRDGHSFVGKEKDNASSENILLQMRDLRVEAADSKGVWKLE
ncbi:hypothetical protein PRIPAC_77854 [Pristionchus pacificus]|uniref:G protein-coupled receptor n=1 Tax=Pristionchus pacificus TaxID=54126 RepID=A0A2A6C4S1_PRIPA|nr:hypothetical protein PRIPAC_77854 [Pristionchus pacificus]|eukprot:PDM73116.1 G protein-coupled receptor [Pristionchus pacificus]